MVRASAGVEAAVPPSADSAVGAATLDWRELHGDKAGFLGLGEGVDALGARLRLLELACPGLFGDPHALSFWGFWGHGWFDGGFPYIISGLKSLVETGEALPLPS